jgi:hypothetical protein
MSEGNRLPTASLAWRAPAVPLAFAALKLLLQAFAITNYGYFRD